MESSNVVILFYNNHNDASNMTNIQKHSMPCPDYLNESSWGRDGKIMDYNIGKQLLLDYDIIDINNNEVIILDVNPCN